MNEAPQQTPSEVTASPRTSALIAGGVAVLLAFRTLGSVVLEGFTPDLGSLYFPAARQAAFVMTFAFFGSTAVLLLTWGLTRQLATPGAYEAARERWLHGSDAQWMRGSAIAATLLALLLHLVTLRGARLTDDESAYAFMAELLSRGRLYAQSPPLKLFFDNAFMINDGRLYAKYLLGWPMLLAPGVWIGIPGCMNALYFGLTVPPLYRVLQDAVGSGWARAGTCMLIASPMLLVGAATMLSHTSCMCVLAWAWYVCVLARDSQSTRLHAALGALLGLAVLIRPSSAIGIGAPLALAWLTGLRSLPARARWRAVFAFAGAGGVLGALLLAINHAQTGSALLLAYARMEQYTIENLNRFSPQAPGFVHTQLTDPMRAIAMAGVGLLRLSFSLFGWPCGLVLAWLALGEQKSRTAWLACLGFTLVHLPLTDAGIDTFGPVHWYEIALPILVLTAIAFARVQRFCERGGEPARGVAPALLIALIASAWTFYMPIQAAALSKIADDVLAPSDAVEAAGLHDAVVFSPRPWGASCYARPTRNFASFRPNNDAELERDVLWVNHLGLERDKELIRLMPGRTGYILVRAEDCTYRAFTLDAIDPALAVPMVDDGQDRVAAPAP